MGKTTIMGQAQVTAAQMQAYIRKINPSVPQSVIDMIPLYLSEGAAAGNGEFYLFRFRGYTRSE